MEKSLSSLDRKLVNNSYYDTPECRWTDPQGPLALLKVEGKLKNKWVRELCDTQALTDCSILDIGCGGGYLANELARAGHSVTGIDLSGPSLDQARQLDETQSVEYLQADAYDLPFLDQSFNVVTCLDFLEHVSKPHQVIKEAARVLQPGGIFIYHTFSRNFLSYLIAIKGVEWFVKGTPEDLHVYPLFIKPSELQQFLLTENLLPQDERGLRPVLNASFWNLLRTREIDPGFKFQWTQTKFISYMGWARK